jgi:hypothetical protein
VTLIPSLTLLPTTAKAVAAYLFRSTSHPHWPWSSWSLLAQTVLRGPDVNRPELQHFRNVGMTAARDLVTAACP